MSRSYSLVYPKGKDKKEKKDSFQEFIIQELYISGSNMVANDIFVGRMQKDTSVFDKGETDEFMKNAKINLQKEYNYIKKDMAVVFMAELNGVDKEKLKNLQKAITKLTEQDLSEMINNSIIELSGIAKADSNGEFKLLKLFLLLDILNSDDLIETTNVYKDGDAYKYLLKIYGDDKLKPLEKELLEIRDKMTDLMAKMDILQDLFTKYESKYVDKDYILSSFVSNYDDILMSLKIIIFLEISKLYDLDIYYNS